MSRNYVNLNINPCKMCMPLGAVTAFKGIEGSMFILHGSQGCSTYIRRHMAGHYNEPIDVASSSLTEEGTVYGGESNLKKGLLNIIRLYNPRVIGVSTTCLAETIGEDIKRIISNFYEENPDVKTEIVTVATPGYGGTQFEGFYAASRAIVEKLAIDSRPTGKINVIAGNMNPGEIREIKRMLDLFEVGYTILPDVSNTLDAPHKDKYERIPEGGTTLEDIKKMAGAKATIEFGLTISDNLSPAKYLEENFKIPSYKSPHPVGIENTDYFLKVISQVTGKEIPSQLTEERGRFLDAMIDSHKHNAEGRAVVYGEPEQVLAIAGLCAENGIKPVLFSTGSENKELKVQLEKRFISSDINVLDDIDFDTIRSQAVEKNANILIGNSDGKFITEKENIPLVRVGFPIHDRIGGQRQGFVGYKGSLELLDMITNTLLEYKLVDYRERSFKNFYRGEKAESSDTSVQTTVDSSNTAISTQPSLELNITSDTEENKVAKTQSIEEKTKSHPCYSGSCNNARMHIPVAPACNIGCNYCNRKFDCVNESRPGVTSEVLTPEKALEKYLAVKAKVANLKVVGIAGPGDALANWANTKKSLELIRAADPEVTFCLSTNGLMLPYYAEEIVKLGVTHITVTMNTIDPEIGAKLYRHINFMGNKLTGKHAAEILLQNQLLGIKMVTQLGAVCKVNIVMVKGVNDEHIPEVVAKAKELGAFMTNIMPLIPASGSVFENMPLTSNKELNDMRKRCEIDLKQMYHCKQCRADAIGTLGNDISQEFSSQNCKSDVTDIIADVPKKEITFAIATKSGMLVDSHFGQVEEFVIYKHNGKDVEYIEKRIVAKYCDGVEDCDEGESKIKKIIRTLDGCDAVLALRIGHHPLKALEEKQIKVFQTCGRITDEIKRIYDEILATEADSTATNTTKSKDIDKDIYDEVLSTI